MSVIDDDEIYYHIVIFDKKEGNLKHDMQWSLNNNQITQAASFQEFIDKIVLDLEYDKRLNENKILINYLNKKNRNKIKIKIGSSATTRSDISWKYLSNKHTDVNINDFVYNSINQNGECVYIINYDENNKKNKKKQKKITKSVKSKTKKVSKSIPIRKSSRKRKRKRKLNDNNNDNQLKSEPKTKKRRKNNYNTIKDRKIDVKDNKKFIKASKCQYTWILIDASPSSENILVSKDNNSITRYEQMKECLNSVVSDHWASKDNKHNHISLISFSDELHFQTEALLYSTETRDLILNQFDNIDRTKNNRMIYKDAVNELINFILHNDNYKYGRNRILLFTMAGNNNMFNKNTCKILNEKLIQNDIIMDCIQLSTSWRTDVGLRELVKHSGWLWNINDWQRVVNCDQFINPFKRKQEIVLSDSDDD